MPTKFELERDAQRLARHQRVAEQIKETDKGMSREISRTLLLYTGDIVPDPDQPRRFYEDDEAALQELAASIRAVGVLSPIQVRPHPDLADKYMIIVGERRWRACRIAGVNRIEAVIRDDWDPFQIRAAQYEENEKRQDVSDIARARSLTAMRQSETGKKRGWEEIAARLGMQRNHAMRLVGLLQLPEGVISLIDRRLLPGTHGAELVRLLKHVPDVEIVALAESCAASMPGGKARCPVKELARTVTDRLQAIHEQQNIEPQAKTRQEGFRLDTGSGWDGSAAIPQSTEAASTTTDTTTEAAGAIASEITLLNVPEQESLRPRQESQRPGSEHLGQETSNKTSKMSRAEAAGFLESVPVEDEFGYPRVFVQELVHIWKSGLLTSSEQRLIRETWTSYPLLEDTSVGLSKEVPQKKRNVSENRKVSEDKPSKIDKNHADVDFDTFDLKYR